jgi:Tol biopolymer transport system component
MRIYGLSGILLLIVSFAGCGGQGTGNNSQSTASTLPLIVFVSDGALDGSDAINNKCIVSNNVFVQVSNLWVVKPDGSGIMPVTKLTQCDNFSDAPVWSPDGTKLGFESGRPLNGTDTQGTNINIWVVKPDGTGATHLTGQSPDNGSALFAWSPDGSKVAFNSIKNIFTDSVWVMNADGSGAKPMDGMTFCVEELSSTPDSAAVWSPDGSKLLLESNCALDGSNAPNINNCPNIWVINADGTGRIPLTKYTFAGGAGPLPSAAWSRNGAKVLFTSKGALDGSNTVDTNSDMNLWVMNADGTGATPLTKYTAGVTNFNPHWSPDGTKIAFESSAILDGSNGGNANATRNIWIVGADGTGATPLTKLTANGASSFGPSWSPDGARIVFASARSLDGSDTAATTTNIWIVNSDGSNATALTKLQHASSLSPAWRP